MPAKVLNVVVYHSPLAENAPADELDVLVQAQAVHESLLRLGHQSQILAFGPDTDRVHEQLHRIQPDVVFNLVETIGGDGQLVHYAPYFLQLHGQRITGCSGEAIHLSSNKLLAKELMQLMQLPTPAYIHTQHPAPAQPDTQYLLKAVWEHASYGIDEHHQLLHRPGAELQQLLAERNAQGRPFFAEQYIDGREFNVSILGGAQGPEVLPIPEMLFVDYPADKPKVVGYRSKWDESSFEYHHTQRQFGTLATNDLLYEQLHRLSLQCWRLFRLRGYARVDFRVDAHGHPYILEINANPGIAPDAGFVAAAAAAGIGYTQLIERILHDALC